MIHRVDIEQYPGSLGELAEDVGDLRYDSLTDFFRLLAAKLANDAAADQGRGRPKLAAALHDAATHVASAASGVERAWGICQRHT
jgi:hypothetical protein